MKMDNDVFLRVLEKAIIEDRCFHLNEWINASGDRLTKEQLVNLSSELAYLVYTIVENLEYEGQTIKAYNTCSQLYDDIVKAFNVRRCSNCKQPMKQGYVIDNGVEYYCSDECLHQHYTTKEFLDLYDDGDSYYTEWEDYLN